MIWPKRRDSTDAHASKTGWFTGRGATANAERPTKSRGDTEAPGNVPVEPDTRPLEERVRDVGRRILINLRDGNIKLPMLPAVATDALALAGNPDVSFREIHRVISTDALITAKVISTANSALYAQGTPITALMSALNRLGMGTLRDVMYQAVAEAHFFHGVRGETLKQQREHAIEVAHAARLVSNILRLNSDFPFLCGLLHDIGRTVLLEMLDANPPPELHVAEIPRVIDGFHAIMGEQLVAAWNLPNIVGEAARYHHRYIGEHCPEGRSQYGNLIACAERALRRPAEAELDASDLCFEHMGFDSSQLAKLFAGIAKLRSTLAQAA